MWIFSTPNLQIMNVINHTATVYKKMRFVLVSNLNDSTTYQHLVFFTNEILLNSSFVLVGYWMNIWRRIFLYDVHDIYFTSGNGLFYDQYIYVIVVIVALYGQFIYEAETWQENDVHTYKLMLHFDGFLSKFAACNEQRILG